MAIQDIRRAKALAVVLESAKIVDVDGNEVDLKALDAEMMAAQERINALDDITEIPAPAGHDHDHDHEGHDHDDHEGHNH
jgi:hypothetical protein